MKKRMSKWPVLIAYVILFYGIWMLWEFYGKPFISNTITNEYLAQWIKSGLVKNCVWTLPAILLIRHLNVEMYVPLKEMFVIRMQLLKYFPTFLLFTVYLLASAFITTGDLAISETFHPSNLIIVLFVGLTEETVFRGWLLNASVCEKRRWGAVLLNALLFLFIHFPGWIQSGCFVENFQNFGFLSVLILSIIFSWTFIKSKNIWVPILLHMYWDFLMFLFY